MAMMGEFIEQFSLKQAKDHASAWMDSYYVATYDYQ